MANPEVEDKAARTVAAELGLVPCRRDDGKGTSVYDFDLVASDEGVVALEVTTSVDSEQLEFWASGRKHPIDDIPVTKSWSVALRTYGNRKLLRQALVGLTVLENAHEPFQWDRAQEALRGRRARERLDEVDDTLARLAEVGVQLAEPFPGAPGITIGAAVGGWSSPETVNEVAQDHAWRDDNRGKLGRAPTSVRHLFIWADVTDAKLCTALSGGIPPRRSPDLAPEVTGVWVGNSTDGLWRAAAGGHWEVVR